MNLTKGLKTELTYDELLEVFACLHDAQTAVKMLQRAANSLGGSPMLDHLEAKIENALGVTRPRIEAIETANPEVFAQ